MYEEIFIPKRRGEVRRIYIPSEDLSARLESYKLYLAQLLSEIPRPDVSYGFEIGKNCALMATQHIGFDYTLSIDLKDFFDHVTVDKIPIKLPASVVNDCFVDGRAPQGFSTSPFLANLATIALDTNIVDRLIYDESVVYTRYADDLVISFDDLSQYHALKRLVVKEVVYAGFIVNQRKTRLQLSKNGRRIITGIGVDEYGIFPTRKTLRRLRAANHQNNVESKNGLVAWSKCTLPKK
ncbi:reverse transcriptase family protein [Litoricolaceae bacterium]|nr:reverse transcriptase family protein [Litorivicinaceae bacterium]